MTANQIAIKEIWQKGPTSLGIVWTDGIESSYEAFHLRVMCPCALCVDEQTHQRKVDPKKIDAKIMPTTIKSVGRYAVSFSFTDGHKTGIYSFETLRALDPAIRGDRASH